MAASDSSAQNVRFNLDEQQLEFALGITWTAVPNIGGDLSATSLTVSNDSDPASIEISPNFGGLILSTTDTNVVALDFRDGSDVEQATWTTTIGGSTVIADYGTGGIILQTDGGDAITLPAKGGFIPQPMTTTERDAIVSPGPGTTIYNSTTNALNFYNGASWKEVAVV